MTQGERAGHDIRETAGLATLTRLLWRGSVYPTGVPALALSACRTRSITPVQSPRPV